MTLGVSDCFNAEKGRHDDPQALETCKTVIWIDRLRNIKQRKCWQHNAGPKIGNYKKSLKLTTRTYCVSISLTHMTFYSHRSNWHNQNMLLSPLTITETSVNTSSIDFIVKITNVFSNRATSEHSATLLKFIYIVWATPKRFFLTIRREIIKLKPNQSLQVIKSKRPPARRTRDHKNIVFEM